MGKLYPTLCMKPQKRWKSEADNKQGNLFWSISKQCQLRKRQNNLATPAAFSFHWRCLRKGLQTLSAHVITTLHIHPTNLHECIPKERDTFEDFSQKSQNVGEGLIKVFCFKWQARMGWLTIISSEKSLKVSDFGLGPPLFHSWREVQGCLGILLN